MKPSQIDKNEENSEFLRLMTEAGRTRRVTTPSYAEFIEFLTSTFDQKPDENEKTRPDMLSASRSMRSKQFVYQQVITKLLSTWGIRKERHETLRAMFRKIENLLSHLKSITICSSHSRDYGDGTFFRDIALPQIIEILQFLSITEGDGFWKEMHSYFADVVLADKSTRDCITGLRNDVKSLLEHEQTTDFRAWLDRLDSRSFPKLKSIEESLTYLRHEILAAGRNGADADEIITKLKYKFLAAKATFRVLKFIGSNQHSRPRPLSKVLANAHNHLCDHICIIDGGSHANTINSTLNEQEFISLNFLKEHFLKSIENLSAKDVPNEDFHAITDLLAYKNGTALPLCVYRKFTQDLSNGNIDEAYLSSFEDAFLSTSESYQYGELGSTLATLLLGMKIKTSDNIPHRSLEPLAMAALKNSEITTDPSLYFSTPFGRNPPMLLEKPEFVVANAVGLFNRKIMDECINQTACNPFEKLDNTLKFILTREQGGHQNEGFTLPSSLKKRPIKYASLEPYETLKNLNDLLFMHELVATAKLDADGATYVEESLAGQYINEYLAMTNAKKREILRIISPDEYNADLEKMQSPS